MPVCLFHLTRSRPHHLTSASNHEKQCRIAQVKTDTVFAGRWWHLVKFLAAAFALRHGIVEYLNTLQCYSRSNRFSLKADMHTPISSQQWCKDELPQAGLIHPFMQVHPGTTKKFRQGSAQQPNTEQRRRVSEHNITAWDSIQLQGTSKLYDEVIKQFLHWIYELIVTVISRSQWLVY